MRSRPRPRLVPSCAPRSFDCSNFHASKPNTKSTAHFYLQYKNASLHGLTVNQYGSALETTWDTEIGGFGWARPPKDPVSNPPGGRYPVRIERLGLGLYGFVTGTHYAAHKNNPATPWNDRDAIASCMVLNQNFGPFPGSPTDAMRATVAHEFNHSLQFGYGALTGYGSVDSVFVEGGATWMEDEVFDTSNDNYNYLWPSFTTPMGKYAKSPYPYWIVFRAMTEPFGTGNANGGEKIFQTFWEQLSKGDSTNLQAMNKGFRRRVLPSPRPITTPRSRCASCGTARAPPSRTAWRKVPPTPRPSPARTMTCSTSVPPTAPPVVRSPTTSPSTGWACRP